jgi:hypothetical protein
LLDFDDDDDSVEDEDETAAVSSHRRIHLTSLYYRPFDSKLRSPLIIGLDSKNRIRAFTAPMLTSSADNKPPPSIISADGQMMSASAMMGGNAASAAAAMSTAVGIKSREALKGASQAAVEAAKFSAMVALGVTNIATLGLVNLDAVNLGIHDKDSRDGEIAEVDCFVGYTAGDIRQALSGKGGGFGEVHPSSTSTLHAPGHSCVVPARLNDGLYAGLSTGEIFVLNPHSHATSRAPFGGLLPSPAADVAGSGVASQQVVAKLSAHVKRVSLLDVNDEETSVLSTDAEGEVIAWTKVPVSSLPCFAGGAPVGLGIAERAGALADADVHTGAYPATISRLALAFQDLNAQKTVGRAAIDRARLAAGLSVTEEPHAASVENAGGQENQASTGIGIPRARTASRSSLPREWVGK